MLQSSVPAVLICLVAAAVAIPLVSAAEIPVGLVQPACGMQSWCAKCGPKFPGSGVITFDLSPIIHNLTYYNGSDYELVLLNQNKKWELNVCSYTVSQCGSGRGIVYFQNTLNNLDCHYVATGNQPVQWNWLNSNDPSVGISQHYVDGDSAGCTNNVLRSVKINYYCQPGTWFQFMDAGPDPDPDYTCAFVIDISTQAACPYWLPDPVQPEPPAAGLSGGSIFLIILLVVSFVYFVGGALFRWRFMHNSQTGESPKGWDLIPNRALWAGCCSLVADGCRFSYYRVQQAIGSNTGGGGGSGRSGYDEIGSGGGGGSSSVNQYQYDQPTFATASLHPDESGGKPTAVAIAAQAANSAAAKSVSASAPPPPSPYAQH